MDQETPDLEAEIEAEIRKMAARQPELPESWIRAAVTRRLKPSPDPKPRRRRGRPRGSRTIPLDQLVLTFRRLRVNYGRQPTQPELAANTTPSISVRTLQDHLTAYGLPWPIE